jgi:hypothetical protein
MRSDDEIKSLIAEGQSLNQPEYQWTVGDRPAPDALVVAQRQVQQHVGAWVRAVARSHL